METFRPEQLPNIVEKYYKRRWEMKGEYEGIVFAQVWKDNTERPFWRWFYDDSFLSPND